MGLAFFVLLILTLLAVADPLGNNRASATSEPNSNGNPGLRSSAQNLWCVAKNNADDAALQRALDWACGPGGADCGPIQQGRPCYDSTSFQSTASYAFNDYFRKHGDGASCDFAGTAALASLDPSHGNCKFPYSVQAVSNGGFVASGNGVGTAAADNSGGRLISTWLGRVLITIGGSVFISLLLGDVYCL